MLILSTIFFSVVGLSGAELPSWTPRNYAAQRVSTPINIDGDIYKKVWDDVPWSDDFVEIRGEDSPAAAKPDSKTRTRMKMRWDDDFLYIASEMTAKDYPILAEFTKRNEPIYQKDSDIEVFLDTDGSNSNYKEFEMNARNTVWNLLLDKPYSAGGGERSGREHTPGQADYWDVKGQKTAAKMYGAIGKEQANGKWTAEIALKHTDSLDRTSGKVPALGDFWRIGFSRVEKGGDINWVWTPQMIWNPAKGKYVGLVNMHAPDGWGYVVFAKEGAPVVRQKDWVDPAWKVKAAAHQLFYAEKHALSKDGQIGKLLTVEELEQKGWIDKNLFDGFDGTVTKAWDGMWSARVQDASGCFSTIQQDNIHSYQCPTIIFGMVMPPLRYAVFGFGALSIAAIVGMFIFFQQKNKLSTQ